MGATGEARRKVTDSGHDPAWSPDGRSLAVASEPASNPLLARTRRARSRSWTSSSGARRALVEQDAVQPAWSPDGRRIAFWGLRGGQGGTGRRDIWTVAATGGEPVEVTDDQAVDWSPVWSPDGRLYFSSGRGGTHEPLARADRRRLRDGRSAAPEPVTTPARSSAGPSFSRDGKRLAFVAREERSTLYRVAFDPERGRARGHAGAGPRGLARDQRPGPVARRGLAGLGQRRAAREPVRDPPRRHRLPPDHRRRLPQPRPRLVRRRQPDRLLLQPQRAATRSGTSTPTAAASSSSRSPSQAVAGFRSGRYDGSADRDRRHSDDAPARPPNVRSPSARCWPCRPIADGLSFQAMSWSPDGSRACRRVAQRSRRQRRRDLVLYDLEVRAYQPVAAERAGARTCWRTAAGCSTTTAARFVFWTPRRGRTAALLSLGPPSQSNFPRARSGSRATTARSSSSVPRPRPTSG